MMDALWQLLISAAGTLGFAILFYVPRRHYFWCALTGAVGWLVYWLLMQVQASTVVASLIAVVPLTLLSRLFSLWRKAPSTVFLFCGIFPLVPGAGIYYTAYYFIQGDMPLFVSKGMETFKIAVAIALGIAVTLSIPLPGLPGAGTYRKPDNAKN